MTNKLFEKKTFTSFDKNYSAKIFIKKPDKYRDIENHSLAAKNLITMGSACSYTAASFKKDNLSISLEKFSRVTNFDKKNKSITVEGGMKIYDFLNFTLGHKLWIPQIPGYPLISIAGAVATNAHGKSCGFHGTIRNLIKKITIFHRDQGWVNLSENENKEIFELTIGGFGLTGTIIDITFQLVDFEGFSFNTSIEESHSAIDTVKKIQNNKNSENFVYSWNRTDQKNIFGNGFIFQNKINLETKSEKVKKIKKTKFIYNEKLFFLNLWNKYSIKTFNSIYYNYHKYIKKNNYKDTFKNVIFPFVGKEKYFYMFGKKGFIETQILVSNSNIEAFLEEFESLFKEHEPTITLFSVKNMSGKQSYLRFEDNRICLTFDFVNNKKNMNFMKLVDNLCIKYKAFPSIIKDSRINETTINECYEYANNFREDLKKFDKKRIYRSELSDRLGL